MQTYKEKLENGLVDLMMFTTVDSDKELFTIFVPEVSLIRAKDRLQGSLEKVLPQLVGNLEPAGKIWSSKVTNIGKLYDKIYPKNKQGGVSWQVAYVVGNFIHLYKYIENEDLRPSKDFLEDCLKSLEEVDEFELCAAINREIKEQYTEVIAPDGSEHDEEEVLEEEEEDTHTKSPLPNKQSYDFDDTKIVFRSFFDNIKPEKLLKITNHIINKSGQLAIWGNNPELRLNKQTAKENLKLAISLLNSMDSKFEYDIECLGEYATLLKDYLDE